MCKVYFRKMKFVNSVISPTGSTVNKDVHLMPFGIDHSRTGVNIDAYFNASRVDASADGDSR
jgi:hypothetical protein